LLLTLRMNITRIYALVLRYLYLYPRSIPRILDVIFWPIVDILIWGFLTAYLAQFKTNNVSFAHILLGAIIFWDFVLRAQQSVSISFLEEVWERNLLNLFVTPITLADFILATVFVGLARIFLIGATLYIASLVFFQFNLFSFGILLIPLVVNLFFFGWILGLIATSILLRFGQSAQVLAFALTTLIQPFMAVFYPVSVLPKFLQYIALSIPATHVFEGMRTVVIKGIVPLDHLVIATLLNFIWLTISLLIFVKMFEYVRNEGKLLKLTD